MKAVAGFMNKYFHPATPVLPSQIIVASGVTSLLDILPFNLADEGEAIMYATPIYGMFNHDIVSRNGLKIVEVPTEDMPDQFLAENAKVLVKAFEKAYLKSLKGGVRVRAILICNPCNPLGRCYSRATLVELAQFCAKYMLQLISDEIYAMSAHTADEANAANAQNETEDQIDTFTSVLTLDTTDGADPENIHTLYGASKDFGMGGLRLGFLITRNAVMWQCVRKLW
jgi:aspartate/methionine/tyrosine aminotransferase